jgi:hypothetical protein
MTFRVYPSSATAANDNTAQWISQLNTQLARPSSVLLSGNWTRYATGSLLYEFGSGVFRGR